jgi:hypothetical protein
MSMNPIWAVLPSRRTLLTVALSSLFGGALAVGITAWMHHAAGTTPSPQPPYDPRFVAFGRAYVAELGKAYAGAWDEGAKSLDAGQVLSTALKAVAQTWRTNRTQLFDRIVTPELGKLVPETTNDADVTIQERAAMSAAWRGFALGLRK